LKQFLLVTQTITAYDTHALLNHLG